MKIPDFFWLRVICFLACMSSGGALLGKVYGLASMQLLGLAVALPCGVGLLGVWFWARRTAREALADALTIGFLGGLLGTFGYDLFRVPFHLLGLRVFAPISAFGVWLADAPSSSRLTEVLGWSYHFSNGITFGIMYALFMRERHWGWAVLWALVLETIAVLSPFGRIFLLAGNYYAIAIAYAAHIAYGLPLGLLVWRWNATRDWLARVPAFLKWAAAALACAALGGPLFSPERDQQDARTALGEFRVEGERLNPGWLRIERGGDVRVHNPDAEAVSVLVKPNGASVRIAGGQTGTFSFSRTGIYQIFVETERRSQSSFIIVEPVEDPE